MNGISIDLGCGKKKRHGYLGFDSSRQSHADIICDLRSGLPCQNEVACRIFADNLLEHIPDLVRLMNEIWRVCRHGAEFEIVVPYYTSMGAFQDPTHVRFFTEKTFLYFNRSLPYDYGFNGKFDIKSISLDFNPEFQTEMSGIPPEIAKKYFMNAVSNMNVTLIADKSFAPC